MGAIQLSSKIIVKIIMVSARQDNPFLKFQP